MRKLILSLFLYLFLLSYTACSVSSINAKPITIDTTLAAQPTRESLEQRLNELADAAYRHDAKRIESFVLGGRGKNDSWNRQAIWELVEWKPETPRCKNPIIYIWGYCAYTRCWTDKYSSSRPCPQREGSPEYWVFKGGQWYLAEPPYRNTDFELKKQWMLFVENHKNKPCDSNDHDLVIQKTKQFMDLMMEGKIDQAAQMYSLWSSYKVFDTSFNLEDGRIDQACLFYEYQLNSFYKTISYKILEPVLHQDSSFAVGLEGRTCFYHVTIQITKEKGENEIIHMLWFKEDGELKVW